MPQVIVPLPDDLHEAVTRSAEQNERSRPAEIRYLLRAALEKQTAVRERQEASCA